jgi:hypothetical protein
MNRITLISCSMAAVAVLSIAGGGLHAQALWDYRVGDTPSRLSKLGPVSSLDKYKGNDLFRWVLPDQNSLRATVDPEGEIVYLESAWGGKSDETGCDLAGLKFGTTTLADLRQRFGSNGFAFKKRPHVTTTDDGVELLNSWDVGNVVVTFYTRISTADYAKAQAAGADGGEVAARNAKLFAISLANAAFAKGEWGDRMNDPAYKKIEWK